jgi:hypothetical protein
VWIELLNPLVKNTYSGTTNNSMTLPINNANPDTHLRDNGAARLMTYNANNTANSLIYNVVVSTYSPTDSGNMLAPNAPAGIGGPTGIPNPANVLTQLDVKQTLPAPNGAIWVDSTSPGGTQTLQKIVQPVDGTFNGAVNSNQGFYVIGPKLNLLPAASVTAAGFPAGFNITPNLQTTLTTNSTVNGLGMTYTYPNAVAVTNDTTFSRAALPFPTAAPKISIYLRRLAIPHLPWNDPDPTSGSTYIAANPINPYVTVDYIEQIQSQDNRVYDTKGQIPIAYRTGAQDVTTLQSFGRREPYRAFDMYTVGQNPPAAAQPKNTFYRQNSTAISAAALVAANSVDATLTVPFNWLVHLDRPLVNPLELLHVSGYPPHGLTQKFITSAGSFKHYAPWFDQKSLIYRLLELVGTSHQQSGTYFGSRVPGRININTLTAAEVFQALCDAQANNTSGFASADVISAFTNLTNPANPTYSRGWSETSAPTSDGLPFKSFGIGFGTANTNGVSDTLLRTTAAASTDTATSINSLLLSGNPPVAPTVPNANGHPYMKTMLLQKIFNNTTTTSNTFAVWATIGFFEVVDDTVMPPKLGPELGRSENKQIRHRFFSIIDRSELTVFRNFTGTYSTTGGTNTLTIHPPWPPPWPTTVPKVYYKQGDMLALEISQNNSTEYALVTASNPQPAYPGPGPGAPSWTFNVTLSNTPAGAVTVTCRGNPGPKDAMQRSYMTQLETPGVNKVIPVHGPVSLAMASQLPGGDIIRVQIGPDPIAPHNTEIAIVTAVNTASPANQTITVQSLTRRYNAGTPITWRAWQNPTTTTYNPRADNLVVPHISAID